MSSPPIQLPLARPQSLTPARSQRRAQDDETPAPTVHDGRRIMILAPGYLAALVVAEISAAHLASDLGWLAYGFVLLLLLFHAALYWNRPFRDVPLALAFAPAIRLALLFQGTAGQAELRWCLSIGLPLLAAVLVAWPIVVIPSVGSATVVGFLRRRMLGYFTGKRRGGAGLAMELFTAPAAPGVEWERPGACPSCAWAGFFIGVTQGRLFHSLVLWSRRAFLLWSRLRGLRTRARPAIVFLGRGIHGLRASEAPSWRPLTPFLLVPFLLSLMAGFLVVLPSAAREAVLPEPSWSVAAHSPERSSADLGLILATVAASSEDMLRQIGELLARQTVSSPTNQSSAPDSRYLEPAATGEGRSPSPAVAAFPFVESAATIRSLVLARRQAEVAKARDSSAVPASPALDPMTLAGTFPDCPGTTYRNLYLYGVCTWYVKEKREDLPMFSGSNGLAINWLRSARLCGFRVSPVPAAGAVIVFPPWGNGAYEGGHVAYVEAVGDTYVLTSECNVDHSSAYLLEEPRWWVGGYPCGSRQIPFYALAPGVQYIHRHKNETLPSSLDLLR